MRLDSVPAMRRNQILEREGQGLVEMSAQGKERLPVTGPAGSSGRGIQIRAAEAPPVGHLPGDPPIWPLVAPTGLKSVPHFPSWGGMSELPPGPHRVGLAGQGALRDEPRTEPRGGPPRPGGPVPQRSRLALGLVQPPFAGRGNHRGG